MSVAVSASTFGGSFAIAAVAITGVWLLSIPLRNVSIIDVWWSLGFVVMACYYASAVGWSARALYIFALLSAWAVRLAAYLYWRNHIAEHGAEDKRYAAMRKKVGDTFWWRSAYAVFLPQLIAQWLVGIPLLFAMQTPETPKSTASLALDALGLAVYGVGLLFEVVGDRQLTAFKAKPENAGKLCAVGLWRATRHPNYFGNATMWWGVWLMACAASGWAGALTAFAPAIMHYCLVAVTGVALTEKVSTRRKPGFEEYAKRTPAFVPDLRLLFAAEPKPNAA